MVDQFILNAANTWVPLAGVQTGGGGGGGGGGTGPASFPGDPGPNKILWGLGRQGGMSDVPARAAQFATDVGHTGHLYPKTGRSYITPFSTLAQGITLVNGALSDAALVKSWGSVPFVDCKELSGHGFADVAAGVMDQVIDALMEGAVALDWPIVIGYHQEPVGDGLGDAVDYGKAVGRFAQRRDLAGGKANVTVTGCIGFGAFPGNGDPVPWFQNLAPVSDVWGSHKYLQYKSQQEGTPPGKKGNGWLKGWSMHDLFGQYWDMQDAIDSTKVRVHGEWGVHTRAANLATAPQFMDELLTYAISYRVRLMSFFDSGLNSNAGGAWTLDSPIQGAADQSADPTRRKHFAQQLLDPRVSGPSAI